MRYEENGREGHFFSLDLKKKMPIFESPVLM